MTKTMIICEKPSQAKNIRKAVGSRFGEVLPAAGHIVTLSEPEQVRSEWKDWSVGLLWPGKFYPKIPKPNVMKYLEAIKSEARSVDTVIVATDHDREGQVIGEEILDFIGFKGKRLRAVFNAEDETSLRKAFSNLKPISDFAGLYASGIAREQADQVTNLSLTRTATVVMKLGGKGAIGIGRVKTPVLGIACKREKEILNFKPQDLFEVDADIQSGSARVQLTCARLPDSLVKEEDGETEEDDDLAEGDDALEAADPLRGRIQKRDIAEGLAAATKGATVPLKTTSERKKQGPPKLFDLTSLSGAASSRFGWSGDKTLKVAQSLYSDHQLITYPRGDAQYLPEANIPDVKTLLPALLGLSDYSPHGDLLKSPQVRKGKSGHFCDKCLEGMPHYAIIPNVNTADRFKSEVARLSDDGRRLWDIIVRQYMAALAPDHEYQQVTISTTHQWKGHDWIFRTSGRTPLVPGWKEILSGPSQKPEDGVELPSIKSGSPGQVQSAAVRIVTTKPPARYSEGALMKVMKQAWRLVEDPKMRARLKEADGIGTPATRGEVIKGLLEQGQIIRKGKTLQPSPSGMALYDALLEACPNVVDPGRTAMWETIFDAVESGKITAEDAVIRILKDTKSEIERIKVSPVRMDLGEGQKPSKKMADFAKSLSDKKGIALPKGALSSAGICREFIDKHAQPREKNASGEVMPSEKQLEFARRIAREGNVDLADEDCASAKALSTWIDANMKKMPVRPPSEKQLAFARKLADEKGVELLDDVKSDMKVCSAFIDKNMGKGKSGGGGARSSRKSPARPVKG